MAPTLSMEEALRLLEAYSPTPAQVRRRSRAPGESVCVAGAAAGAARGGFVPRLKSRQTRPQTSLLPHALPLASLPSPKQPQRAAAVEFMRAELEALRARRKSKAFVIVPRDEAEKKAGRGRVVFREPTQKHHCVFEPDGAKTKGLAQPGAQPVGGARGGERGGGEKRRGGGCREGQTSGSWHTQRGRR